MQIQVNTDNNIEGGDPLSDRVESAVETALSHYSRQITRVEIHLSDENGDKGGGDDKRCVMEARLEGRQPTAVTHRAATLDEAIDGAAGKLARSIENTIGRLAEGRGRDG